MPPKFINPDPVKYLTIREFKEFKDDMSVRLQKLTDAKHDFTTQMNVINVQLGHLIDMPDKLDKFIDSFTVFNLNYTKATTDCVNSNKKMYELEKHIDNNLVTKESLKFFKEDNRYKVLVWALVSSIVTAIVLKFLLPYAS